MTLTVDKLQTHKPVDIKNLSNWTGEDFGMEKLELLHPYSRHSHFQEAQLLSFTRCKSFRGLS